MVFDRLNASKVTLKPSKCQFAVPQVKYLGHILSAKGAMPNPEKTTLIDNCLRPHTVKRALFHRHDKVLLQVYP